MSSPFLCGYTADWTVKPLVFCGAAAAFAFSSTVNSGTYYICAAHLDAEQIRIPAFVKNVTPLRLLAPDTQP